MNRDYGIHWRGSTKSASGELINSTIMNNGWGVYCDSYCSDENGYSNPLISNNIIAENSSGGIFLEADGYIGTGWVPTTRHAHSSPQIEFNEIFNNSGNAIKCFADGDLDNVKWDKLSTEEQLRIASELLQLSLKAKELRQYAKYTQKHMQRVINNMDEFLDTIAEIKERTPDVTVTSEEEPPEVYDSLMDYVLKNGKIKKRQE